MKVFISQPMRDRTKTEILQERKEITKHMKDEYGPDVEIIDSFVDVQPEDGHPALMALGKSLQLMAHADLVYFAKGWEKARGCCIENECAIEYGLSIREDYRKGA